MQVEIKFGEIIKAKREEKNYTLVHLSKVIGISAGYLSQLENGRKNNPKLEIVLKIIKELDIDINTFFGIEGACGNSNINMPSLLEVVTKDSNYEVLEDKETLEKICKIMEKTLECKYRIENKFLYELFLDDLYVQIDTILKKYMAFEIVSDKT
jgi:transcriptional regulator with XRE-family HTH domain